MQNIRNVIEVRNRSRNYTLLWCPETKHKGLCCTWPKVILIIISNALQLYNVLQLHNMEAERGSYCWFQLKDFCKGVTPKKVARKNKRCTKVKSSKMEKSCTWEIELSTLISVRNFILYLYCPTKSVLNKRFAPYSVTAIRHSDIEKYKINNPKDSCIIMWVYVYVSLVYGRQFK